MAGRRTRQPNLGGVTAPLPESATPQLPTLVATAPAGDNWLHEIKFDGYRMLARIEGEGVELLTRNGHDWSYRFPAIRDELRQLPIDTALLDGEIVAMAQDGRSDFARLQDAISRGRTGQLLYQVFDLIYLEGQDLRDVPLIERKHALQALMSMERSEGSRLRYTDHIIGHGPAFFKHARQAQLEGIVAKRVDSRYQGKRTRYWVKVKHTLNDEFIIVGYTVPSDGRPGFSSLLLGAYDDAGNMRYVGRVGTGFDARQVERIWPRLHDLEQPQRPFTGKGPTTPSVKKWVRPELVAQVVYMEMTREGKLRHPAFSGLREDKGASEVRLDRPPT